VSKRNKTRQNDCSGLWRPFLYNKQIYTKRKMLSSANRFYLSSKGKKKDTPVQWITVTNGRHPAVLAANSSCYCCASGGPSKRGMIMALKTLARGGPGHQNLRRAVVCVPCYCYTYARCALLRSDSDAQSKWQEPKSMERSTVHTRAGRRRRSGMALHWHWQRAAAQRSSPAIAASESEPYERIGCCGSTTPPPSLPIDGQTGRPAQPGPTLALLDTTLLGTALLVTISNRTVSCRH
jgi:hypothetical protein